MKRPWYKRFLPGWFQFGGGGGGLSTVTTDATLTGKGTGALPLSVAVPYTPAAPGNLGLTTPAEAEFTSLGVGAAPDGTAAHILLGNGAAILTSAGNLSFIPASSVNNFQGTFVLNVGLLIIGAAGGADTSTMRIAPVLFASLSAPSAANKGQIAVVSDSTTAIWGAPIAGGGANLVLAFCDGTNWTVAAM